MTIFSAMSFDALTLAGIVVAATLVYAVLRVMRHCDCCH